MKTACVYHSIDLDGWMSAAIVKHWFSKQEVPTNEPGVFNTIDFIGYNYGQPLPDLSQFDRVIMVDVSFPKDAMYNLNLEISEKLIYIDHHISAIKDIFEGAFNGESAIDGIRDTKYAACELTWNFFFPDEPMPEIVRLLGRYDCFGHKGTDEELKVLEFQYGARRIITDVDSAYNYLTTAMSHSGDLEFGILVEGAAIYQYLCTEAKQTYKNGFEIMFYWAEPNNTSTVPTQCSAKFICINKERFNPINFGIDYHKNGYDGCACFHYDGIRQVWAFSLYNDNGLVDCSVIAKQFSGGGHKGAAGFVTKDIKQFINQ